MELQKSSNFDEQAKKMTRLVVQMGTCDGERAAAAALRLVDDVAGNKIFLNIFYHHLLSKSKQPKNIFLSSAPRHDFGLTTGIDVNMGCPKGFSLKGGMGAALLTQPEKVSRVEIFL